MDQLEERLPLRLGGNLLPPYEAEAALGDGGGRRGSVSPEMLVNEDGGWSAMSQREGGRARRGRCVYGASSLGTQADQSRYLASKSRATT